MPPILPQRTMIVTLLVSAAVVFVIFFVLIGDTIGKVIGIVIPLALLFWTIFSTVMERRADVKAVDRRKAILDGSYFRDPAWREAYLAYKQAHPWEICKGVDVRRDLSRRYRRSSHITFGIMSILLLFATVVGLVTAFDPILLLGFPFFGWLLWIQITGFLGRPVLRWYRTRRTDPHFPDYEASYRRSQILCYRTPELTSGISIGPTHILLFGKEDIHTIELSCAKEMTRRVVRQKDFQDSTFVGDKYRHFDVLHVETPRGSFELPTELDEYQVEMAVEAFMRLRGAQPSETGYDIALHNENVT